ncbi:PaaI family thioesterase [Simiduia aestuariiviva]|uniref:Acyl-coenzyme A thioesterase PaaI-like protein n=1 Tax=Simiduia aestuariiviva TaxID=1510459 RepID=A0A839US96_9GAMM|nr:PaaI family thioesterase [Simiduia aestuariiviva]MBB3169329.1 acyl-coenzyme A thioesterase PaaI-like protein [Simiduia aestuariiviva]
METAADAITKQLTQRFPDVPLTFPPACFVTMGGEFLWFDAARRRLRVRFPVKPEFANPMGFMQGGLIVGAIDNTVGPLTFLVAPPSVTTQMNTSYIRPITPDLTHFEVEAVVTEQTRRLLFVDAVVYAGDKQLAQARASCTVMEPPATGA